MHHNFMRLKSLKQESLTKAVEAIAVMIFSLFTTVLLPSIIFRFFYADKQLLEQPKVLEYIPIAAFALGFGYFIYAMVGNIMRALKVRQLEAEMMASGENCCSDMDMGFKKVVKMAASKIAKSRKSAKK